MKHTALWAAWLLALSAHAAAAAPALDCTQLDAEIARAEATRRGAIDHRENAWKAVVPFVVLARKAGAKATLDSADATLAELKARAQRCEAGDGR